MAALCNGTGHFIFAMVSSFYLFFSPSLVRRRLGVSHTWRGLSADLRCRSETCCTRLAENTGCKNLPKNRHLGTITQLCGAMSSQLRHASTIGKKVVKQQYLLHMSPQYGELWPTIGWDRFVSLGHPYKLISTGFDSSLKSVTARHSSSERQPNFAALNRGRHICLAGWPSRWALAHISSLSSFAFI